MNDYEKLCYAILKAVENSKPSSAQALLDSLSGNIYFEELRNENKIMPHDVINAFESLIDRKYIDGLYRKTKNGTAYAINGLADLGREILS